VGTAKATIDTHDHENLKPANQVLFPHAYEYHHPPPQAAGFQN
jgi:hypothetical protein